MDKLNAVASPILVLIIDKAIQSILGCHELCMTVISGLRFLQLREDQTPTARAVDRTI